jgi:hypothetical protein
VWRTTQRSRRQHCETTEEGDVGRYRTNPCHRQALEGEPSQFLSLPAFERERLEAAPVGLFLRKKKLSVRANGMSLAELVQDRRGADWERCRIWCAGSRLTDAARETWFEEAWRRADSGGKKRVLSESQGDPCCFQALWKSDRGETGARGPVLAPTQPRAACAAAQFGLGMGELCVSCRWPPSGPAACAGRASVLNCSLLACPLCVLSRQYCVKCLESAAIAGKGGARV